MGAGEGGGLRPPAGRAGGGEADHRVLLRARQEATVSGVLHVVSFDDHEIVLETDLGTLTITGQDLQIKQLDLAQGTFHVQGQMNGCVYAAPRGSRGRHAPTGGMLGRLFR